MWKRDQFFSSMIESSRGDQRMLFQAVNTGHRLYVILNRFWCDCCWKVQVIHYSDKIWLIRDSLPVHSTGIPNELYLDNSANQTWPCEFTTFQGFPIDFIGITLLNSPEWRLVLLIHCQPPFLLIVWQVCCQVYWYCKSFLRWGFYTKLVQNCLD